MKTVGFWNFTKQGRQHNQKRWCDHAGCIQATREGKPYCSDHVDDHSYVREVMDQLAEREAQDEAVSKRGAKAVDLAGSITAREIMLHLGLHGVRSVEKLCQELAINAKILDGYLKALHKAKLITFGSTKRGSTTVASCIEADEPLTEDVISKPRHRNRKRSA